MTFHGFAVRNYYGGIAVDSERESWLKNEDNYYENNQRNREDVIESSIITSSVYEQNELISMKCSTSFDIQNKNKPSILIENAHSKSERCKKYISKE